MTPHYQGLLGIDSSCWQVLRSVRNSIKGNEMVAQSLKYEEGLEISGCIHK